TEVLVFSNPDHQVNYDWSSDGSKIIYDYSCGMYSMNPDGSGSAPLPSGSFDCFDDAPDIRYSDGKIVFHNVNQGLFTINSNGSARTVIPNSIPGDIFPRWSPDGQFITFTRYTNSSLSTIVGQFRIKADGTGLTQLTPNLASGESIRGSGEY